MGRSVLRSYKTLLAAMTEVVLTPGGLKPAPTKPRSS